MGLHLDGIDSVELAENRGRTELRLSLKDSKTVLRFRECSVRRRGKENEESKEKNRLSDWYRDILKQKNALITARGLEPEVMKRARSFVSQSNETFPTYNVLKQFISSEYDTLTFRVHRLKLSNMLKTFVKQNGGQISSPTSKKNRRNSLGRRLSDNVMNAVVKSSEHRGSPSKFRMTSSSLSAPSTLNVTAATAIKTPQRRRSPIVTPHELLRAGYRLTEKIGKGSFAYVFKAFQMNGDHDAVAVKVVDKEKQNAKRRRKEIETLRVVHRHRNFVSIYDTIESERYLFIVSEFVSGGELFDFVIRRGRFSEDDCRVVAKQLLEAVAYMHAVGIVCHFQFKYFLRIL